MKTTCMGRRLAPIRFTALVAARPTSGSVLAARRDRGAADAVARERCGDEAGRLHVLDETIEVRGGGLAARLRQAHRLADHHEAFTEQAQAAEAGCVRLELLPNTRGHVSALREESVDDRLRRRRAQDRG